MLKGKTANKIVCPEGTEINPVSGRCVKICVKGKVRDVKTGKCVKDTKIECPEGTEINPVSGRCVKICVKGKVRDVKTGKCVKDTKIECPEGTEINPVSGRCVKICVKGKVRDVKTGKCVKDTKIEKLEPMIISKSSSPTSFSLYYPDLKDDDFPNKISRNMNFAIHKIPKFPIIENIEDFNNVADKLCGSFETSLYQHFVSQYISYKTPYNSILLYHGVGVGKTCSAITMSESLLIAHDNKEPMIWVIMPQSLKQSFKSQIFDIDTRTFENIMNQCTGDTYVKLLNIYKSSFDNKKLLNTELKKILKNRYRLFTYDGFAKYIIDNYEDKIVENKVIIIDEAHNIRSTNKKDKDSYIALTNILSSGVNNKLVLLSATPMYNEPRDILDLFKLMLLNDKRKNIITKYAKIFGNQKLIIDDTVVELIKKLSSTYISYLRGKNPFTFALKLNPENSGISVLKKTPIKDPSNKAIPTNELKWIDNIDNGIVTAKLSLSQKSKIEKLGYNKEKIDESESDDISEDNESPENKNQNMKLLQPMNIVYDDEIGNKGFFTFFTKTRDSDPLLVKYNKKYENALMPDESKLGKYSGKFMNICNIIKKSKGVIVIYSRFVYSGILPFAICLEHMGFTREGTNNILNNAEIIKDKPVYDNIKSPKYCILTSDNKEIMGSTQIDTLIRKINKPENINGELVKVILITPVASEGLSFFNAREIHLIEPWYHFNRPEQIIGRGIRNCRHQNLPLEDRNTTVYLHASINDNENKETIDIHALRISTRKYIDSIKVDKIIRDNALDCILMKNINYFPKSIFNIGKVKLNTSQNKIYEYEFGDNDKIEPACYDKKAYMDADGYNSEAYKHLLKRTQNSLKGLLSEYIKNGIFYIVYDDIKKKLDIDEDLLLYTIRKSIYPFIIINDYYIIIHKDGIKIIKNVSRKINKLSIIFTSEEKIVKEFSDTKSPNIENVIKNIVIDTKNKNSTTISMYLNLDNKQFISLIQLILTNKSSDDRIIFLEKCLYDQGVLIRKEEIPSYKKNDNKYIGYINIYDTTNKDNNMDKLDINLHVKDTDVFNMDITKRERDEFAKMRKIPYNLPTDMSLEEMPWGFLEPSKSKDTFINKLKIFSTELGKGKKTGRVCETYNDTYHNKFLNQINKTNGDNYKFKNKPILCNHIANKLLEKNKLLLLPLYKPK